AMEDFTMDIILGKGPGARSIQLDVNKFTLVGATTRMGLLTSPLRDRFGIKERLEMYKTEDLVNIVTRTASLMSSVISRDAATEIARRSRGTPRIANRLMRRVRDYAQVKADGEITLKLARAGLEMLNIDELGLDSTDVRILSAMINKFGGRPVGLETLAAATGEDAGTIEDVYEPYLIQLGFIERTPRGRVPLPAAYDHLKMFAKKADS
ncbi:MAG: Holliday junction branch migration DNA helicase RuvB, partial [Clostridia bacterium]|nr:Holliday junction branch migration DNA helicase RuvB [Clostridia bacterium]